MDKWQTEQELSIAIARPWLRRKIPGTKIKKKDEESRFWGREMW
jgi:hypothetical protein